MGDQSQLMIYLADDMNINRAFSGLRITTEQSTYNTNTFNGQTIDQKLKLKSDF